jgi:hypothetical protein
MAACARRDNFVFTDVHDAPMPIDSSAAPATVLTLLAEALVEPFDRFPLQSSLQTPNAMLRRDMNYHVAV